MFKARDLNTRQRQFPLGFPVRVCDLNVLSINIIHEAVALIKQMHDWGAKHDLLLCRFVLIVLEKLHAREGLRATFPRKFERINRAARHDFLRH